jgi:5-methylcytosine-specific restriction endonuclease McrA
MSTSSNSRDGSPVRGGGACELCGRHVRELTRHHLIPQTRHKNRRNKRDFGRGEVKQRIALLCRPCHRHVHATVDNKRLEQEFNTVEALAAHPEIARFVAWIRRKPDGTRVGSRRWSSTLARHKR